MDGTSTLASMSSGTVLERESRLSHSLIWKWMDEWYEAHGVDAWSSNLVPNFVTSNSAIASMYARVVLGFLTDVMGPRYRGRYDPRRPIYVVELGGGAGKFAFLLLQQLWEMRAFWPRDESDAADTDDDDNDDGHSGNEGGAASASASSSRCPFVYVLTDVTASNVRFWSRHPCFAPFVARGMLDFAVLDAQDCPDGVALLHSRRTLDRNTNTNPLFLIANYTLDTLKHDAFRMVHADRPVATGAVPVTTAAMSTATNAATATAPPATTAAAAPVLVPCLQLQEALISVASPSAYEPDRTDPTLIKRFRHAFTYRDVPGAVVPLYTQAAASTAAAAAAPAPPLPVIDYYSGRDAEINGVLGALQHRLACVPPAMLSSPGAQAQGGAGGGGGGASSPSVSGSGSGYSVLIPLGGLRCLSFFLSISRSNLAFLCGDKSYNTLEELRGLRDPHLAVHGSFSLMVNFEAVRAWVEARGGAAAYTPHVDGFKVALFTRMVWDDEVRKERREQKDKMQRKKKKENNSSTAPSRFSAGAHSSASSVSVADTLSLPSSAVQAPASSPSGGLVARQLRATALAFHALQSFGPDHFSTLQRCVKDECPSPGPSLKHLLALLRLSHGDADIFFKFRQQIIEQIGGGGGGGGAAPSDKLLRDLRYDLARVGASYYPLSLAPLPAEADAADASGAAAAAAAAAAAGAKDVSFELGRAAMALRDYSGAVDWFARSVVQCGPHHVTHYNAGLSHYYRAQFDDALRCFDAALQLCPDYEEAAEWRQRTQNKIAALKLRQQQLAQAHAHTQVLQGADDRPTLPKPAVETAAQSAQQRPQQSANAAAATVSAAPRLNGVNDSSHAAGAAASTSAAAVLAASPFQPRHGHLPFPSTSAAPLTATTPDAQSAFATPQFYTHTSNSWL